MSEYVLDSTNKIVAKSYKICNNFYAVEMCLHKQLLKGCIFLLGIWLHKPRCIIWPPIAWNTDDIEIFYQRHNHRLNIIYIISLDIIQTAEISLWEARPPMLYPIFDVMAYKESIMLFIFYTTSLIYP